MITDPFTEAARAEAERQFPAPLYSTAWSQSEVQIKRALWESGAEWARTHLAAQEPTDAEVEAAARAIHINTIREFDDLGGLDQHALRTRARKALTAARAAGEKP